MKLSKLLAELTAAEEARQRGLEPASFGKYRDQAGKVVAYSDGDKLLWYDNDEVVSSDANDTQKTKGSESTTTKQDHQDGNAPSTPSAKPTTMSAKDAGQSADNTIRASDTEKRLGTSEKASEGGGDSPEEEGPQIVPPNPHSKPFPFIGKSVPHEELKEKFGGHTPAGKELVIGEVVEVVTAAQWKKFYTPFSREEYTAVKVENEKAGRSQDGEWRAKLPEAVQATLLDEQLRWQHSEGHFKRAPEERDRANKVFNEVGKGPPPATIRPCVPIERGMNVKGKDIEAFLKPFMVGEEVDLPPCGFSAQPTVARMFASTGGSTESVAVLMRMAPSRKGTVNAISLFGVDHDRVRSRQSNAQHAASAYDSEMEVIRPSGPTARVTEVRKMVHDTQGTVIYVIEMEDSGYPVEIGPVTESQEYDTSSKQNEVSTKYLNTPVRQPTKNSHMKLTDLLPPHIKNAS